MEYLQIAIAFLAGIFIGWMITRGPAAAGFKAHKQLAEKLQERNQGLECRITELRNSLEAQKIESATTKIRLEEAQLNLESQKKLLDESKAKLSDSFSALSSDALQKNNQLFLELAKKTLEGIASKMEGDLGQKKEAINGLIKPLQEALKHYEVQIREMENVRQTAYGSVTKHLEELTRTHTQLQDQTRSLATALKMPQVRGRWGEITLRRVVEISGMSPHCDFVEQPSTPSEEGRKRPDLIVQLPNDRNIIIDAKVPLKAYMQAMESDENREASLERHAHSVRTHMISLASKDYWKQFSPSPDFVILFLPAESFFSAALEKDKSLIEDSMEKGVVLATPTTLIALLRTVALSWQQQQITENAELIWKSGMELYERVLTFSHHLVKIRDGLQKATQSYNAALGSWEARVVPCANRLSELGGPRCTPNMPEINSVDTYLREPSDTREDET